MAGGAPYAGTFPITEASITLRYAYTCFIICLIMTKTLIATNAVKLVKHCTLLHIAYQHACKAHIKHCILLAKHFQINYVINVYGESRCDLNNVFINCKPTNVYI